MDDYHDHFNDVTDWALGFPVVEELLGDVAGKRVLDYGCGHGRFSRRLRDLGAYVIAVDSSPRAIAIAKSHDSRGIEYHIIHQDKLNERFSEKDADAAVMNFVLCAMRNTDDAVRALHKVDSNTRSLGSLIVLEPHPDGIGYPYVSHTRHCRMKITGDPVYVKLSGMQESFIDYYRSKEDYLRLMNDAGFHVTEKRGPILKDGNKDFWNSEMKHPPYLIMKSWKE